MRMKMMRSLFGLALALGLAAAPLHAQENGADAEMDEDGGGFLQRTLESNLSAVGREVRIRGFAGALSSNATLDEMTIADDQGVWLRLRDVSLDWTRTALLRGRVQVNSLTASEITLSRLPEGEETVTPEDAEATPFSLPDLPVSINIGEVSAETLTLGAPVLGAEIELRLAGSLGLGGGEGTANLDVTRLDGRGEVMLDAGFDNSSRVLALDLALDEAPGGIAATLLNLPDSPALALTLQGEGPLDDYTADLALATDGTDRLTGRVALDGDDAGGTRFDASLDGDITPLMEERFRAFFGDETALELAGTRQADGALDIDRLTIAAAQLALDGRIALDATGWPTRFDLSGEIGTDDAEPVRLPVAGPTIMLGAADIAARYDAAQGDRWHADISLSNLSQPDLSLDRATLTGRGVLRRAAPRGVTALAEFDLAGLDLDDSALAEAAGTRLSGHTTLEWTEGTPLVLRALRVVSGAATLAANGRIEALADGFPVAGTATLQAPDLARFAALAGQDLGGAAEATLAGSGSLLGGDFDITLDGGTDRLALGIEQVDPLIGVPTTLALKAKRDESGIAIDRVDLDNDHLRATARGDLNSERGALDVTARLDDLARADDRLDGPAETRAQVEWQAGGDVSLSEIVAEAMGARLTGNATLAPEADGMPATGQINAQVDDLARFAAITGRPLSGRIDAAIVGNGVIETQEFDITLDAATDGLGTGIPQVDGLVAGEGTLRVSAIHDGRETTLRELALDYDAARLTASGAGVIAEQSGEVTFDAALADLAQIDPRLDGPAEAAGTVARAADGEITLTDVTARVMGAALDVTGAVQPDPDALAASGRLTASVADLARFAAISGQSGLRGRLDLTAEGDSTDGANRFDVTTSLDGRDLATGIAQLDRLLGGRLQLDAEAGRTPDRIEITTLDLETQQLSLSARGDGAGGPVNIDARLADLGLFVPEFSGPLSANGTVTLQGPEARQIRLNLDATGPGGTTAALSGDVMDHGRQLDIAASGRLPLALANPFIQPRALNGTASYDLRVNGAPALSSVSGTVSTQGTTIALPGTGLAVDDLSGTARLGQSRVQTDFTAAMRDGGRLTITGPVGLTPGFESGLRIGLAGLVLSDGRIYTTTADGNISLDGPLAGGARIGGTINLGETNLRIPSGTGPASVSLPDLRHVNESRASRLTRERAGLIRTGNGNGARPFDLDLTINAPRRIFVRGRGLDAELGGRLRIRGTTRDVAPDGFFELIRGRFDVLGKRLTLNEGRVTLQGSLDPFLRFVAETQSDDTTIRIIVEGLASDPEITFGSTPDLPQEQVVSRLLFGRGLDSISPLQAAQMASAVSTLTGRSDNDLVGRLRGAVGLADLDVTQTEDGDTEVSAGAYLSDDIYTEVTADSAGKQQINLNLDVSRSVTVRGSTTNEGDAGIGVFYERDY
jgi:translocation and assembly module TamB